MVLSARWNFVSVFSCCILLILDFAHMDMHDRLCSKVGPPFYCVFFPSAFYFIVNYQRYYILMHHSS